jgi:hypothetical protein
MPLYPSRSGASPGIVPAEDKNQPTPKADSGDPLQKPDFLRDAEEHLIEVRRELSKIWAEQWGRKYGSNKVQAHNPYSPDDMTVSGMERDLEYQNRRLKLEEQESALILVINEYKYVASLGDAPAVEDVEDAGEQPEPDSDEVGSR